MEGFHHQVRRLICILYEAVEIISLKWTCLSGDKDMLFEVIISKTIR